MQIQWFGNSSFLIKNSMGKKILVDPFNIINNSLYDIPSDIIVLSQNISSTSDYMIKYPKAKFYDNNSHFDENNINISTITSYNDKFYGLKRGINYIHKLTIDNITLLHLGYLGDSLDDSLLKSLGPIDFLFIPIGGNVCLDGLESSKLCKQINSKYIIPMCYKSDLSSSNDFYYHSPKKFLSHTKSIHLNKNTVIETSSLPSSADSPITVFIN